MRTTNVKNTSIVFPGVPSVTAKRARHLVFRCNKIKVEADTGLKCIDEACGTASTLTASCRNKDAIVNRAKTPVRKICLLGQNSLTSSQLWREINA